MGTLRRSVVRALLALASIGGISVAALAASAAPAAALCYQKPVVLHVGAKTIVTPLSLPECPQNP